MSYPEKCACARQLSCFYVFFFVLLQALSSLDLPIVDVSRSHTIRHTHKHTNTHTHTLVLTPLKVWWARPKGRYLHNTKQTNTRDNNPYLERDSNSQSQQSNSCIPTPYTARPSRSVCFAITRCKILCVQTYKYIHIVYTLIWELGAECFGKEQKRKFYVTQAVKQFVHTISYCRVYCVSFSLFVFFCAYSFVSFDWFFRSPILNVFSSVFYSTTCSVSNCFCISVDWISTLFSCVIYTLQSIFTDLISFNL